MNFSDFSNYIAPKCKKFIIGMEGCFLCKKYIKEMQSFVDSGEIIVVDGTVEDEEDFMNAGFDGVPVSLVYDENGIEKFRKYGLLNDSQKMEFLNV